MRVILLNGPPRCGKDTAAKTILASITASRRVGFADHLKEATHAAYGIGHLPFHYFEDVKDEPRDEFFGYTPRKAYICHSETYMKPLHGKDVFGKLWMRRAEAMKSHLIAVPDSGFVEEAGVLIRNLGPKNLLLIRIHAGARGCSFAGDSRSYIDLPEVQSLDIENQGEEADFTAKIQKIAWKWVNA